MAVVQPQSADVSSHGCLEDQGGGLLAHPRAQPRPLPRLPEYSPPHPRPPHAVGLITVALYQWVPLWLPFILLVPVTVLVALLDGARLFNPELGKLITSYYPPGLLRESERRTMSGSFWYLIGVEAVLGAGALLHPRHDRRAQQLTALAILFLALCDPAAAFVGRRFGSVRPAFMHGKSLEGSLAAAAVGCLTTRWFLGLDLWDWRVAKGGAIAAFAEAVRVGRLDDNVTLPIVSACLLTLAF